MLNDRRDWGRGEMESKQLKVTLYIKSFLAKNNFVNAKLEGLKTL